jgi:hypothetical protein
MSIIQDILNKAPSSATRFVTKSEHCREWRWWSSSEVAGKHEISMRYEDDPTEMRTIMCVEIVSNNETEFYRVDVNKVNPKFATRVEMYALLAHQNKQSGESNATFMKRMTLINYASSPKNPAYTGYSSSSYYEERLNFDELLTGLYQDSERESFLSDELIYALLTLCAEYPKHETKKETMGEIGASTPSNARWIL